jgi:N-acetyl-alpha-D-muramate 1-phosphate uridylyltransferase
MNMVKTVNAIRHRHVAARRASSPSAAMILAAGLGRRMLPITEKLPKPLVRVGGMALIDRALMALSKAGVARIVVNVHHMADQLEAHLRVQKGPEIIISNEREGLLDSGGGIVNALRHLGDDPFFVVNSDSFWIEGFRPNLENMASQWDGTRMDGMLLLSGATNAVGYSGMGDFDMDPQGRLVRRDERKSAPFVYAGAAIFSPGLFAAAPQGPFSLNLLFDRALERERLFGVRLDGLWFHVGTPESIREAEEAIARSAA